MLTCSKENRLRKKRTENIELSEYKLDFSWLVTSRAMLQTFFGNELQAIYCMPWNSVSCSLPNY